ncbi:MAG: cyclase family protein, partial [Candidatus Binataceae bacterium]
MNGSRMKFASMLLLALAIIAAAAAPPIAAQAGSLADAYRIIASKQFLDLTNTFSPVTPVWKGFGQAAFSAAENPATQQPYSIDHDGFRVTYYS